MTSETDSRKRADAEVVAWKFKYEKAEQEKLYAQTHQKTVGYESILFLLAWYSITTLFTAILSPVFLNDCNIFFGALGKGMGSLFREFYS